MRGKGIYRRGKVWWICYAGSDKQMRFESSHSSSHRDAETLLTDRRKAVDDGREPAPKPIKDITLAEFAPQYLIWAERQKAIGGKRNAVKLLLEKFGNLPLRQFSGRLVEQYQTELLREGKRSVKDTTNPLLASTKTAATVNRYVATLKHMIRKAVDWELLDEGTLLRVRKAKALRENNRRLRYLSGDEAKTLINACADHLKPIVICALNTGMRREEILSLEWDKHIDLRHGFILLDTTKNGERRQIPISPMLRETLSGIVRRVDVPYVFCCKERARDKDTKKDRAWIRYRDCKTGFHAACRRAGIKDFRFHDLRHTFASLLVMGGVDLATVRELMGHKTISMTLRYSHLAPAHKLAALGVLDGAFNEPAQLDSHLTIRPENGPLELPAHA